MARSPDSPAAPDASDHQDSVDALRRLRSTSPRTEHPPRLDSPGGIRAGDRPTGPDQPASWSRDDLRRRLDRLPPGHPSSPSRTDLDRRSPGEKPERDHPGPPDGRPDSVASRYWHEVPRLLRAWADHVRRWPADPAPAADRSEDPPGSWRGDGGQYLDPAQHSEAKDEIAEVRLRGEALTQRMEQIESENAYGGRLAGLEFALKGEDRLKEKIAELLEASAEGDTAGQIVRTIPDAVRYTFCFDPGKYEDSYWDLKQRLEDSGFSMIYSKNHWRDDPEYRGINTRWMTTEGQRFEVQFHIAESFHAKQEVTHQSYERSRNPLTAAEERVELDEFQREVCSWITAPEAAADIPDYHLREK